MFPGTRALLVVGILAGLAGIGHAQEIPCPDRLQACRQYIADKDLLILDLRTAWTETQRQLAIVQAEATRLRRALEAEILKEEYP